MSPFFFFLSEDLNNILLFNLDSGSFLHELEFVVLATELMVSSF